MQVHALDLGGLIDKEQIGSLKQALTQGAETAVKNPAQKDSYLGNDKTSPTTRKTSVAQNDFPAGSSSA